MKVAVVSEHQVGAAEGMAIAVKQLVRALSSHVEVVDFSTRAARGGRSSFLSAARLLRSARPDVVYYLPKSGLTTASLLRAKALRAMLSRPVVFGCLQSDRSTQSGFDVLRPDAVIVSSERAKSELAGVGISADVARLGVDRAVFSPHGLSSEELWPDQLGRKLLHVGHLTERRNLGVLAELSRRGYNCLVVASPSTPPDPAVVAMLNDACVAIHRSFVPDIAAVYRAADTYVFPVEHERGCIEVPLSVLEALASGTPVVATPFGALPELAGSVTGLQLVQARELAAALDEISTEQVVSADGIPDWGDAALEHLAVLRGVVRPDDSPHFIVLIGVDGTGKSTQAKFLESDATAKGLRVTALWTRWEPRFVRPVMALAKRSSGSSSAAGAHARVMSRKRRIFRSPVVRYLWKWVAGIDYYVQIVPRVRAARRDSDVVISDRYFQDALVDMGANFGSPAPSASGPFRFFPKPDRVVLLDAPEDVVFARKEDVPSLEYLRERRPLYLELARRNGWPIVDASGTADEVRTEISAAVWGPV